MEKQLNTNFRIMEQIRARVDAIVEDPKTAAALKPYYPYGCKRPTFHDEYLPAFNLPHVHLVDTAPTGVHADQRARRRARRRRVPAGRADLRHRVPVDGDLDLQHDHRSRRADAAARSGRPKGPGPSSACTATGFPNLFIMTGPQGGGGSFNFTDAIEAHADYVVWMLTTLRERGEAIVDVAKEPEDAYAEHCRDGRHRHRPAARLPLLLQRARRRGARQPRLLRRRPLARMRIEAQATLEPYIFKDA